MIPIYSPSLVKPSSGCGSQPVPPPLTMVALSLPPLLQFTSNGNKGTINEYHHQSTVANDDGMCCIAYIPALHLYPFSLVVGDLLASETTLLTTTADGNNSDNLIYRLQPLSDFDKEEGEDDPIPIDVSLAQTVQVSMDRILENYHHLNSREEEWKSLVDDDEEKEASSSKTTMIDRTTSEQESAPLTTTLLLQKRKRIHASLANLITALFSAVFEVFQQFQIIAQQNHFRRITTATTATTTPGHCDVGCGASKEEDGDEAVLRGMLRAGLEEVFASNFNRSVNFSVVNDSKSSNSSMVVEVTGRLQQDSTQKDSTCCEGNQLSGESDDDRVKKKEKGREEDDRNSGLETTEVSAVPKGCVYLYVLAIFEVLDCPLLSEALSDIVVDEASDLLLLRLEQQEKCDKSSGWLQQQQDRCDFLKAQLLLI